MTIFGNHKNSIFFLSVAAICLYFSHISLAYISYQINERILIDEKEKYSLRLEKRIEHTKLLNERKKNKLKLLKESEAKKKILNIFSKFHTGLNSFQLKETARVIHQEGKKYGYDPMFLLAIIMTESSFYNRAVSNVGARGLMQLMPFTAKEIALKNKLLWKGKNTLYNPLMNVKMGTYYLYEMESKFGNLQLALEAYNNGPRRLNKMLNRGYLPTRYSNKVFNFYEKISKADFNG